MKATNITMMALSIAITSGAAVAEGVYMPGLNPEVVRNTPGVQWAPEQPRQQDQMQQWQQQRQQQEQQEQRQRDQAQQRQQEQTREWNASQQISRPPVWGQP